ncbi:MAG: protein kinase domain-containing protein [Myxococcota bacterium]
MAPVQFGNYQIIRKIGAGGMAQVFEAQRVGLEGFSRRVALKCILPEMTRDARFVEMFVNEARLGSLLHHPNIVEIQDFNKVNDIYYIAMEFVEGVDLGDVISRFREQEREFPPSLIIEIMLQTLDGLGYAHEAKTDDGTDMNLVHRDIKPSNLLLTRRGTVKIADFGIAKAAINAYQTRTAELTKGSLAYMAPEQITREALLSPASDIFSLGAVLFEMLSLRVLFDGENMPSIMFKVAQVEIERDLSELEQFYPQFIPVLKRALAKNVEARYTYARQMAEDLRALKAQFPETAHIAEVVREFLKPHTHDDEEETIGEQTASLLGLTSNPMNQFQTVVNLANHNLSASNPSWNTSGTFPVQQHFLSGSPMSVMTGVGGMPVDPSRVSQPSLPISGPQPRAVWPFVVGGLSALVMAVVVVIFLMTGGRSNSSFAVITSDPIGAEILVNGELRSTSDNGVVKPLVTPARVSLPDAESATLLLRKAGFSPYSTRLAYKRGEEVKLSPKLEPEQLVGELEITSIPSGANIELNGKLLAEKTPTLLTNLSAGQRYNIQLSLAGYVSTSGSVEVIRNGRAVYNTTLLAPAPTAMASAPTAATQPVTPTTAQTTTGSTKPTPAPVTAAPRPEKPVETPKTEPAKPPPTPAPEVGPPGTLVISAVPPDCVVYVDGARKGSVPQTLKLSAGSHRVKLERFDGTTEKEFSVKVVSGEEVTRVWDMDANEFISE